MHNSRYTQPKDEEDSEPPGKPASAYSALSSPPGLPLLTPSFCLSFLLTSPAHVAQFRSLPLGAKGGDGDHLYMCPCCAGIIVVFETSARK